MVRTSLNLAALALLLTDCSTYTATRYSVSADTVTALRSLRLTVLPVKRDEFFEVGQ